MIKIKTGQYEGPLDLLLGLIEKEELDITQISLAKIADQFIEFVKTSSSIKPEKLANFLVVAAKLLLIKSKAILPYLFPEEEEEIEELEKQLKIYKEFLDASKKVQKILGKKKFMFAREFNRKVTLENFGGFSPPKNLKAENMAVVYSELLERIKPTEELKEEVIEEKIKIEDKILSIQNSLLERINTSFNKVVSNAKSKTEVIVSFLAMLELMRMREVVLHQDAMFGEIYINRVNVIE